MKQLDKARIQELLLESVTQKINRPGMSLVKEARMEKEVEKIVLDRIEFLGSSIVELLPKDILERLVRESLESNGRHEYTGEEWSEACSFIGESEDFMGEEEYDVFDDECSDMDEKPKYLCEEEYYAKIDDEYINRYYRR